MSRKAGKASPLFEQGRFRIMAYLAGPASKAVTFNDVKRDLEFTQGNLSVQLQKLKQLGYIRITKDFHDNKPRTTVNVTDKGVLHLKLHLEEMQSILKSLNKGVKA